jgi:hypothetical protein
MPKRAEVRLDLRNIAYAAIRDVHSAPWNTLPREFAATKSLVNAAQIRLKPANWSSMLSKTCAAVQDQVPYMALGVAERFDDTDGKWAAPPKSIDA